MPIHKFIRKPSRPPVAIVWHPKEDLVYPAERIDEFKWAIYAQENLTIKPHETKTIMLEFGVEISIGVIIVSLYQDLKQHRCSIQNESVAQSTPNIVISIQNNSDKDVGIFAGQLLCHLTFIIN